VSYRPAILRDDGSFVVAGQMRPPAAAGYPLHLIDSTGKVVRSFGVDAPEFRADITRLTDRRVAAAQNGGVWAVAPGRYVVERWDPNSGARQLALHVKSSWFKESTRGPAPGERPTAHIDAIWERDGHLWVLFLDVDQRWKPLPASELEKPVDPHRYNQSYDWVIEALNPATGDVVASKRFDRVMWQLSPGSLVTSLSLGSSGEVAQIDVVTAELQRKSREEH
jgi:hypothetical protein